MVKSKEIVNRKQKDLSRIEKTCSRPTKDKKKNKNGGKSPKKQNKKFNIN